MPTELAEQPVVSAPESDVVIDIDERIRWYKSPIDKKVMARLMERSDWRGFRQVGLHLGLVVLTGAATFYFWQRQAWLWMIVALYVHCTFYGFLGGGTAGHELSHRTVFKSRFWNDLFLWMSTIMGWSNHVFFRTSHVKHHQVTVHSGQDLEVLLPAKLHWRVWIYAFAINFWAIWFTVVPTVRRSFGVVSGEWEKRIFPESNPRLRRQLFNCSRIILLTHLVLAAVFLYYGLWIMLLIFTFAPFLAGWLQFFCGFPQHAGLQPNVADFRVCCRTMILSPFVSFLYWQMNYHVEHHMYPAVPLYNLPKLRKAIEADLPPAHHGLWATWKELLPVLRRQRTEPDYVIVPQLPQREPA